MKKKIILCGLLTFILASCSNSAVLTTSTKSDISTTTNKSDTSITSNKSDTSITSNKSDTSTTSAKSDTTTSTKKQESEVVNLDIISLNDTHGYEYESSFNSNYNLANFSYYVEEKRNEKDNNVVVIANGDMFQGTAFSNLSHGKSAINAMNEVGFDMMGIGNHEFDWTLDSILSYFDNDETNGEANFPLINGNVKDSTINGRIGESDTTDNILPYTIVQKGDLNVGLLSYIGDQTESICKNKFGSYYIDCSGSSDKNFIQTVKSDAKTLKTLGADVIILNFHEGSSEGVDKLYYNQAFANLKDDSGDYLIDAVINGHTHTSQSGEIKRDGGANLPIVQAYANCNGFGEILLSYDLETKSVVNVSCDSYMLSDKVSSDEKNKKVEDVLEHEYSLIKNDISEVYATSYQYASKSAIGNWLTNIMKRYCSSDIAIMNTGGIRSTMDSGNITIEELYKVNPFDNALVYLKVKGSELKDFYDSNQGYYYYNSDFNYTSIDDSLEYNLVTIDFVYYGSYFQKSFKNAVLVDIDTNVCARDLMVLDLKSKKTEGLYINTCEPTLESHSFPQIK